MILNGRALLCSAPIKDMLETKVRENGVSHGLTEAGYDIRVKEAVDFTTTHSPGPVLERAMHCSYGDERPHPGRFLLASSVEEFQMPGDLVGVVHDKSTWARRGLSVFNTVIEPGWKGFLTLELVYHGEGNLCIPAGSGIAQVIFSELYMPGKYDGKYQNQPDRPVDAILEKG